MSRRRKILIEGLLVICVVSGVAVKYFLDEANQPNDGIIKVSKVNNKQNNGGYTINLTPKKIVGRYVSFDYPAGMTQKPQTVFGSDLETFAFTARDVTTWQLGVNVSTPKGGTLNGDSGFNFRAHNPALYQESYINVNNQQVTVMSDKTVSFGKVAYLLHGAQLATVSLYGDDTTGTQPLQNVFMMVLDSLHWQ